MHLRESYRWTCVNTFLASERSAHIDHLAASVSCAYPFVLNPVIEECVIKCPPPGLDDPTYSKIYQVRNCLIEFYANV